MAWFDYDEAIFWWALAILVLLGRSFRMPVRRKIWSRWLAIVLVIFGGSDMVQAGGPWWSPWWLLVWKVICVVGLVSTLYRLRRVW